MILQARDTALHAGFISCANNAFNVLVSDHRFASVTANARTNFSLFGNDEGGEAGDAEAGHDGFDFRSGNSGDVKFDKVEIPEQGTDAGVTERSEFHRFAVLAPVGAEVDQNRLAVPCGFPKRRRQTRRQGGRGSG